MNESELNKKTEEQLKIFSIEDLQKTFNKVEDMDPAMRETFCTQVAVSMNILETIIKYGIWQQYEILGKFSPDVRMNDIARGGINALSVMHEFIKELKSEHDEKVANENEEFDPNKPIPE